MVIQWDLMVIYPLVMTNIAIENNPVEIVDFPIQHGDVNHSFLLVYQRVHGYGCYGMNHLLPMICAWFVPWPASAKANTSVAAPMVRMCSFPMERIPEIVSKLENFQELINTSTQIGTPKSGLAASDQPFTFLFATWIGPKTPNLHLGMECPIPVNDLEV